VSLDILILAHRNDGLTELSVNRGFGKDASKQSYTIGILAGIWRQLGLTVAVKRGSSQFSWPCATAAINHVNLTVTPAHCLRCLRRFTHTVNAGFTDSSKSKYCRDLLRGDDGYDGPVIVKTDLNFGGRAEYKLQQMMESSWRRQLVRFVSNSGVTVSAWDPYNYPIYDHASQVPIEVWNDPNLVVQKFQAERSNNGLYCLRSWYFLGDCGFHVVTASKEPIVKGRNAITRQIADIATPPEIELLRKELRVDFGRLDYGLLAGKSVVYDINRTPAVTSASAGQYSSQWRGLAEGIFRFLN
jgi:hypothetical protein